MSLCGWAYIAVRSLLLAWCWGCWSLSSTPSAAAAVPALRGRFRRRSIAASTQLSAVRDAWTSPAAVGASVPHRLAARCCWISVNVAYGQMSSSSATLKSASSRCRSSEFGGVGRWTSPVADEKWTEKIASSMFEALLYDRLQYSAIDRPPVRFGRSPPDLQRQQTVNTYIHNFTRGSSTLGQGGGHAPPRFTCRSPEPS